MKYLLLFIWIELIVLFASGCEAPRERRGDWMEHLNYKQFDFKPLTMHWQRHHYYSEEELKQMWIEAYNKMLEEQETKEIESLHQRSH
jgi:hypothetical protein